MMGIDFGGSFEEMPDKPEPAKGNGHDQSTAWPVIAPAAYHGLAGEVVARILPDTESDPAALLLQYLVSFGNAVGRGPYYQIESSKHANAWRSTARGPRSGVRLPMIEIERALLDHRMLGAGFDDIATWRTWVAVLKAAFGRPLDERELGTFTAVAGDRASPRQRVRELWCVAGRRSGKSRIAAAVAMYLALFVQHRLAKGERGMCLVIAGSVDQARMVQLHPRFPRSGTGAGA
jgi:hypothetical protein